MDPNVPDCVGSSVDDDDNDDDDVREAVLSKLCTSPSPTMETTGTRQRCGILRTCLSQTSTAEMLAILEIMMETG